MESKFEELLNVMNDFLKVNNLGLKIYGNPKFAIKDNSTGEVKEISLEAIQGMNVN